MTSTDPRHNALLVVDLQPDFMPGGALAVAGGDELVGPIAELMASEEFGHVVATQDWHPAGHVSFASRHGRQPFDTIEVHGHPQTLWPDHCVQGTPGAALHPDLPVDRVDLILRKGTSPDVDSYSGFSENWNADGERASTGLGGWLRERGVSDVTICGLARDVCVKWTAEDAVLAGFATTIRWDLARSVDPEGDDALREQLEAGGVRVS